MNVGIIQRCSRCNGQPELWENYRGGWWVECSAGCGNETDIVPFEDIAWTLWNQEQKEFKELNVNDWYRKEHAK